MENLIEYIRYSFEYQYRDGKSINSYINCGNNNPDTRCIPGAIINYMLYFFSCIKDVPYDVSMIWNEDYKVLFSNSLYKEKKIVYNLKKEKDKIGCYFRDEDICINKWGEYFRIRLRSNSKIFLKNVSNDIIEFSGDLSILKVRTFFYIIRRYRNFSSDMSIVLKGILKVMILFFPNKMILEFKQLLDNGSEQPHLKNFIKCCLTDYKNFIASIKSIAVEEEWNTFVRAFYEYTGINLFGANIKYGRDCGETKGVKDLIKNLTQTSYKLLESMDGDFYDIFNKLYEEN